MKDKAIQWFLGLLMCVSCIGCDDFLTQEPINAVTNQNYWETEKDARIAMNGLLSSFRDARGDVVVMYRDRGWPFDVLGTTWTKISNNDMSSYDATNPRFTWWPEYDAIAIANSIIANLHRIGLPEDRFNNYMGQARFIRAYLYFCVVRDFGDVPLLVKSEDIEAKPRTSGAEVLDFVINEYLECSKLLPPFSELKDSDGKTVTSKGVPCLGAVNAALAHAYAWKAGIYGHPELWNKVAEVCQEVINSGEYSLLGSPQGGNLSPLLANVYLNEFDQEFNKRGVPCIRYADDIVLLAKSERASERLLESSTKYLEGTLKLKVNREKSRTVSVFAIRNFKYLGFCFGKSGKGIYVRVHGKSWKKAKEKLRKLTSRSRCGSIVKTMERIKEYMRGWLNYYSMADMKNNVERLNRWLYRRIRMCIWKQWKLPKTRKRKLMGLGMPEWAACEGAYSRKAYWRMANAGVVKRALTKERLINWGFYDLATAYQSMHVNY